MSNIWFFGDSFATVKNFHYPDLDDNCMPNWVWMQQVARNLNVKGAGFRGLPGVSNEWIMHEVRKNSNQMQPTDYIVIVSTHINRRWFIKEKPQYSNIYLDNINDLVSKKEAKAIKMYKETFLDQHLVLSTLYQEQFIAWCYNFAQVKNLRLCLIPAFDETPFYLHVEHYTDPNIINCLVGVDEREFVGKADKKYNLLKNVWAGSDRRLCHMSEHNHTVLAQKVVRFFKYNEKLDFQNGFHQDLFKDKQDLIDYRPRDV